jgi:hypothetical protein
MQDITVHTAIDFKTYLNIAFRATFRMKTFMIFIIMLLIMEAFLCYFSATDWESQKWVLGYLLFYLLILLPVLVYIKAKANMKKLATLREPLIFTINEDKIEVKGETFNTSSNWQYVTKLVEKGEYFMILTSSRTFYYLPKDRFQSQEDAVTLRNIVKEKGIKFSYKY